MRIRRMIVDKLLGICAVAIATVSGLIGLRWATGLWSHTSLALRMFKGLGVLIAMATSAITLFVGYFLLRYPPERRSSAEDISREAQRQGGPVTVRCREY